MACRSLSPSTARARPTPLGGCRYPPGIAARSLVAVGYRGGVETRELRYFVAVAEELHFGRAAQRLGMAQPPLSRAIQQLERRLGVALLERTSRGVALTEAGSVLLREGRAALDAVDGRRTPYPPRRARRDRPAPAWSWSRRPERPSELLAKLLDAYAAEPGAVTVEVLLCGIGEQERLLRDGRADVALLHRPFDSTAGLDTEELHTEGQVAVLPAGHPLSRPRPRCGWPTSPRCPACPCPAGPPDGTYPDGPGPQVHNHTQLLQLIALGRTWRSCRSRSALSCAAASPPSRWPTHPRSRR